MRARLRGHVSIWPLRFWGMRGALAPVLLLFVEGISIQTIPLHDLHDQDLVNHLLEGVAGMTREGHLEARVQTLLEEVHLLLEVYLTGSVPHHASEAVGILLNLLDPREILWNSSALASITPSGMWWSWKVFTPKFGTLTLDREESADGVKSNKYLRTGKEIFFNIFGDMFGNT